MEELRRKCAFASDTKPVEEDHLDLGVLHSAYVQKGKAWVTEVQPGVCSLSVKEAAQADRQHLPCGARTLLFEGATGRIKARGVNKFFDLCEVGDAWIPESDIWKLCSVHVQRKMAGFCVSLFSFDGHTLSVMSKHSVDGPHARIAKRIIQEQMTGEQQSQAAQDLSRMNATATCECIAITEDSSHPVLEEEYDNALVLFSIQRNCVAEFGLTPEEVQSYAVRWGLTGVPQARVADSAHLNSLIDLLTTQWSPLMSLQSADSPAQRELGEGVVLVISMPKEKRRLLSEWNQCARVKVKTAKYVTLRNLRSLVKGESHCRSFFIHAVLLQWAALHNVNATDVIQHDGVYKLWRHFNSWMAESGRQRYRGSSQCIQDALQLLLQETVRDVWRQFKAPITFVMLCGLPGAGKTTVAKAVLNGLADMPSSPFHAAVYLSRDEIHKKIESDTIDGTCGSKHQLRHLKGAVHTHVLRALQESTYASASLSDKVVIVLDACNSTPAARQIWRNALATHIDSWLVVHVCCSDEKTLVERLSSRQNHERLHDVVEAQRALYTVRKKFIPPSSTEGCNVFHLETTASDLKNIAAELIGAISPKNSASEFCHSTTLLKWDTISEFRKRQHSVLLHSMLNVEALDPSVDDVFQASRVRGSAGDSANGRGTSVEVQLNDSWARLEGVAADVLASLLPNSQVSFHSAVKRVMRFFGASSPVLLSGQSRWLEGWCRAAVERNGNRASLSAAQLITALQSRFPKRAAVPHITLYFHESSVDLFWRTSGLQEGQSIDVELTELLIDRSAVAFRAQIPSLNRSAQWAHTSESSVPLHVTLRCSHQVDFSYGGKMFALFQQWEESNTQLLAAQKVCAAIRSREKYHNFLCLKLQKTVVLNGTVVSHTLR